MKKRYEFVPGDEITIAPARTTRAFSSQKEITMKEIDSPDYRAMTAAERREKYEYELEQRRKEDLAIELTAKLKTKMEQNQWGDEVPHPQCQKQLIEIRELLAEWIDESLENMPVVAVALIEAAAGDINPVKEMLDGFLWWYERELRL